MYVGAHTIAKSGVLPAICTKSFAKVVLLSRSAVACSQNTSRQNLAHNLLNCSECGWGAVHVEVKFRTSKHCDSCEVWSLRVGVL